MSFLIIIFALKILPENKNKKFKKGEEIFDFFIKKLVIFVLNLAYIIHLIQKFMKNNTLFPFISTMIMMSCCFSFNNAQSQDVTPLKNNSTGNYYFSYVNLYFEVNPAIGARVSSFKLNGNEILY